jgi:hypothetical protein
MSGRVRILCGACGTTGGKEAAMVKVGLWLRGNIYYLRWRKNGRQCKQSLGHSDSVRAEKQRSEKEKELFGGEQAN